MAGTLCKLGRVIKVLLAVFIASSQCQEAPQYPGTAGNPILSQVMKDLSEAKQMMSSTNDRLNQAENSISRLYQGLPGQGFQGHKLVHLDLSGAPPKMSYLLQLIPFVKTLGGTGFLMEYVDTFPFQDDLKIIRGKDVYSEDEIKQFIQECEKSSMLVIPLVQTFGHFEYILKHPEFEDLRVTSKYTNSISPKNPKSSILIKKIIDQILELHPSSTRLHVGGDEVWNLKKKKSKNSTESNSDIFLGHMIPVLQYVIQKGKTPIMWDDMMREWDLDKLQKMGELVEPMLWGYRTPLSQHFKEETWARYNAAFPRVWMASAFKGAYKSNANYVRISVRLQNNLDWEKATLKLPNATVMGLALTGWSRYDYFGSLCELLPASIPSLAVCLTAVNKGYMDEKLLGDVSKNLGFKKNIDIDADYAMSPGNCNATFPGKQVYKMVCQLSMALHKLDLATDTQNTWILPRQMKTNDISYFRLTFGKSISQGAIELLEELKTEATGPLSDLYSNNTIQEWINDKIDVNLLASARVRNNFVNAIKHYEKVFKKQQLDEENGKGMERKDKKEQNLQQQQKQMPQEQLQQENEEQLQFNKDTEKLRIQLLQQEQQRQQKQEQEKQQEQEQEQLFLEHKQQQAQKEITKEITPEQEQQPQHNEDAQQQVFEQVKKQNEQHEAPTAEHDKQKQQTEATNEHPDQPDEKQRELTLQQQYRRKQNSQESHSHPQDVLDEQKESKRREQERLMELQKKYVRKARLNSLKDDEKKNKFRELQYAVDHRLDSLKVEENSRDIKDNSIVDGLHRENAAQSLDSFRKQQRILNEVRLNLNSKNSKRSRNKAREGIKGTVVNTKKDYGEYAYGQIKPLDMNRGFNKYDIKKQTKPKARLGTFKLKTKIDAL